MANEDMILWGLQELGRQRENKKKYELEQEKLASEKALEDLRFGISTGGNILSREDYQKMQARQMMEESTRQKPVKGKPIMRNPMENMGGIEPGKDYASMLSDLETSDNAPEPERYGAARKFMGEKAKGLDYQEELNRHRIELEEARQKNALERIRESAGLKSSKIDPNAPGTLALKTLEAKKKAMTDTADDWREAGIPENKIPKRLIDAEEKKNAPGFFKKMFGGNSDPEGLYR